MGRDQFHEWTVREVVLHSRVLFGHQHSATENRTRTQALAGTRTPTRTKSLTIESIFDHDRRDVGRTSIELETNQNVRRSGNASRLRSFAHVALECVGHDRMPLLHRGKR